MERFILFILEALYLALPRRAPMERDKEKHLHDPIVLSLLITRNHQLLKFRDLLYLILGYGSLATLSFFIHIVKRKDFCNNKPAPDLR